MSNLQQQASFTFRFSRRFRLSVYASILIFFGIAFAAIWIVIINRDSPNPNALFVVGLAVLFTAYGIYYITILPRSQKTITITQTHITQNLASGSNISMAWEEISSAIPRPFLSRVDLISSSPYRVIQIESQLQGFPLLMEIVHKYTRPR